MTDPSFKYSYSVNVNMVIRTLPTLIPSLYDQYI